MLIQQLFLAVAAPDRNPYEPPPLDFQPSRLGGLASKDLWLIVGACAVLGLLLFLWAYLTRRDRFERSSDGSPVIYRSRRDVERAGHRHHHRRRRRRHHEEEYPRNPTLRETGGLPPPRPDDAPGPSAPVP